MRCVHLVLSGHICEVDGVVADQALVVERGHVRVQRCVKVVLSGPLEHANIVVDGVLFNILIVVESAVIDSTEVGLIQQTHQLLLVAHLGSQVYVKLRLRIWVLWTCGYFM